MKIAIIADSHDNQLNIKKFLAWSKANKIAAIIHCGDIATPESVLLIAAGTAVQTYFVFGNMDANYRDDIAVALDEQKNASICGDVGEASFDGRRVAFCHFPELAKNLAQSGSYDLVFYGHTHKPWLETLPNDCQLINPGTLAGLFNRATFAVYNTADNKLELKILELI